MSVSVIHEQDQQQALARSGRHLPLQHATHKHPLLPPHRHHQQPPQNSSSLSANSSSSPSSGKSPTSTLSGRRKTPQLGAQEKYLAPLTLPSFFPVGSSSATPTQAPTLPVISGTWPTKATTPRRWSVAGRMRQRREGLMPVFGVGQMLGILGCRKGGGRCFFGLGKWLVR